MWQGIATSVILNKLTEKKPTVSQVKTPAPTKVDLAKFMSRSRRRTGYSPRSQPAAVEGSVLSAGSKYNSVLRKLLNITKYA